jgi:ankyrin repeat protein
MSLIDAIRSGDLAQAKKLLDEGADPNEVGADGQTALMHAAGAGQTKLVERLLDAGAEPSLEDETGETALLKAAALGQRNVYALLAPLASEDERDTAAAYLRAAAQSAGEEAIAGPPSEPPSSLRTRLVGAAARTAKFFGDENPSDRVERVDRAEKHRKR